MGILNNRILFVIVVKAGSPTSRCQYGQALVKALLQTAEGHLFLLS
jgi:hypothetical protein